jgi:hypothetical protein
MTLRLPVPQSHPTTSSAEHSSFDSDQVRRIRERADSYATEQATNANAALDWHEQRDQAAIARASEVREARAIIARAATLRADGTMRLACFCGAGVLAAFFVFGGRR